MEDVYVHRVTYLLLLQACDLVDNSVTIADSCLPHNVSQTSISSRPTQKAANIGDVGSADERVVSMKSTQLMRNDDLSNILLSSAHDRKVGSCLSRQLHTTAVQFR